MLTAIILHPDHMTPQAKSFEGGGSCGRFYTGRCFEQEMSAGLSCLYAVSPPLHAMFGQYTELQDNKNFKLKPTELYFSQTVGSCLQSSCRDCSPEENVGIKLRCRSRYLGDENSMKSCLRPKSATNKLKNVTFADAKGLSLTDVKYVTEATEDPPPWESLNDIYKCFESKATNLFSDSSRSIGELLEADFDQPSADYLKFKENLEKNSVCLENIMFDVHGMVSGTVKVKNVSYEKTVFVRMTFDNWKSFCDYKASFVKSFSDYETFEYDTFQFSIPLPDSFDCTKQKAVFCICYQTDGREFWDNNNGVNYSAKAKVYMGHSTNTCSIRSSRFSLPNTYEELPTPEFKTWMEWEKRGPFY